MPSILLMDDEFQFCHQMAELLVANGHHIDTAKSASGATELLKHQRYDLLITDIYVYKNGSPASDGGIALILDVPSMLKHYAKKSDVHKKLRK